MRIYSFSKVLCAPIFIAVLFALPASGFGAPSPNVPLGSWVYPAIEKLEGLGVITAGFEGSRPWSRLEVGRMLGSAEEGKISLVADELLARLRTEFAPEINELNSSSKEVVRYFHPVDEVTLGYEYRDGSDSQIPRINSSQFALDYNRNGRRAADGHNVETEFAGSARYGLLLGTWHPLAEVGEGEGSTLRLADGGITCSVGPIDLFAGRQELWWGQGRHGSLVLTNNARPLDMIRITNPSPITFPWFFKYLGPFRFDVFWSRLEAERVVPNPYFAGLRLSIKPTSWIELGASRTALFGGEGRPGVNLSDFLTILAGKNLSGAQDTSDQIAALDARLRLPFLRGAELYHEWGGEDESGGFISNMSRIYGLYLPVIEPSARASFRFEFADLSHVDSNSPIWYQHGIYGSGYTYDGLIIGHHVGGNSRDFYSELSWLQSANLSYDISLDIEQRGVHADVNERHFEPGIDIRWKFSPNLELTAEYRYDHIKNFNRVAGDNRDEHWMLAKLTYAR